MMFEMWEEMPVLISRPLPKNIENNTVATIT